VPGQKIVSIRTGVPQLRPAFYAAKFYRKSGGAQWRDLLFLIRRIESSWKRRPPLCHPDRSVAKWRDLQFSGPLVEMFFDLSPMEKPAVEGRQGIPQGILGK
jgi:hypothetical protein